MSTEVIIPWLDVSCAHREAALRHVMALWWQDLGLLPTLAVHEPGEAWVKAVPVTRAVKASAADVIVIADADCWSVGLGQAIGWCEVGRPWVIPHRQVRRLTKEATREVLEQGADPATFLFPTGLDEKPYVGAPGGGLLVLRREVYLDCPLDPRFIGWGGEDYSHGDALATLYGHPQRGDDPLFHLWHPPQRRRSRRVGSDESQRLRRRYLKASHNERLTRALLDEFKENADGLR